MWRSMMATVALSTCAAAWAGAVLAGEKTGSGYDGPKEKLHVYILLGGVNMCGRASYTLEEGGVVPRCYLLNREDRWEPAENPLNRYSTVIERLDTQRLGPGYTFAKAMLAADTSVSLGLVVNAQDGATLQVNSSIQQASIDKMSKGSPCYDEAVRRAKAAQQTGVLKGILWHQGEADEKDGQYLDKLKAMIADFRKDLGEPNLPFVAGQLAGESPLNAQIAMLPEAVPFTSFAGSAELKTRETRCFDTEGMKLLGQRCAEAMLKAQGKDPGAAKAPATAAEPAPASTDPGYGGPKEKLHVYLLIGQSNMAGRASFTVDDGKLMEGCWLLNREERWEPAKLPLNRHCTIIERLDTNGMGPGYTFALTMREKDPTVEIGLVSNARGSTSITQWLPNTRYYKEALRRLQAAQQTGTVKGILWHQGESDAKDASYLEKLRKLAEGFRKDLNDPNLPFVAGQIMDTKGQGKLINDQVAALPKELPFTGFASAEGASGDGLHFDNAGQKLLGQRYAEAMLKLQGKAGGKPAE